MCELGSSKRVSQVGNPWTVRRPDQPKKSKRLYFQSFCEFLALKFWNFLDSNSWSFIMKKTLNDGEMIELVETVKKFQLECNLIGKWNTGSTLGST